VLPATKCLSSRPPNTGCQSESKAGTPKDHVVADSVEENEAVGKELAKHSSHGKRSADVEGLRCCPVCH